MTNGADTGAVLPGPLRRLLASAWRVYQEASWASPSRATALRRVAELARAGHDAGWPYPSLGEACGVSASRIQQVVAQHPVSRRTIAEIPTFPLHPRLRPKPAPVRLSKPERGRLTRWERALLRRLAESASMVRGTTRADSRRRKDSEQLSRLLYQLRYERDVAWRDLAEATGRSVSGLRRRLQRHGYVTRPPSVDAYRMLA